MSHEDTQTEQAREKKGTHTLSSIESSVECFCLNKFDCSVCDRKHMNKNDDDNDDRQTVLFVWTKLLLIKKEMFV